MSVQLIQQYHSKVERIIRYGGSRKETAVPVQTMSIITQMPDEP